MSTSLPVEALTWIAVILEERFGQLFTLTPKSNSTIVITFGEDESYIELTLDAITFTRADSNLPCSKWDAEAEGWESVIGTPLPAPGAVSLPTPLITKTLNGMHVAYDILGLTYWMLTRQEEVGRADLDAHGRFPATSSHAYKHGYLDRPVVDEWLHILGQIIKRSWPHIQLKQHSFKMKVSHDVDNPSLYSFSSWRYILRTMGGHLIKRRDIYAFLKAPYLKLASRRKIHESDPLNTFDWIMDQSERKGLSSAFYFICGNSDPLDAEYKIEDHRIIKLMRHIHERGHEIGLHPSYGSYNKPQMIVEEGNLLRRICEKEGIQQEEWGGRMHYLRWQQPITLRAWSDAGFNYESTLGYADLPGFRCGTCYEYPAFDPLAKEILKIRVRPLIVMESTLIDKTYCGLGVGRDATEMALNIKRKCSNVKGVFTLLWHNSSYTSDNHKKMYLTILE
jgi:hypothetical protein